MPPIPYKSYLPTAAEPVRVLEGDCLTWLPKIPDNSIDAVITDPPYPHIKREYGIWTEAEWFALMDPVVEQCRRVLKPAGSAVFVLQPNSERVGRMRTWLWKFMAKWGDEWGQVQDVWWWNVTTIPSRWCHQEVGLTRQSLKACVWLGSPDCYRDQQSVLLEPGDWVKVALKTQKMRRYIPSGFGVNETRCAELTMKRGGSTPFNVLPIPNANSADSAGSHGHSAGTPAELVRWFVNYICPPGGLVLDPFLGSGTTALACLAEGRRCVGVERIPKYAEIARKRIADQIQASTPTNH